MHISVMKTKRFCDDRLCGDVLSIRSVLTSVRAVGHRTVLEFDNTDVMCRFYSNILFLNNSFILSKLCFGLWQMKIVCATQPSPLA